MKLRDIFPSLNIDAENGRNIIRGISDDSRLVNKGDVFFVIKRRNFDIFSVLRDIEPKVSVFVGDYSCKRKLQSLIRHKPIIFVDNIKRKFYRAVNLFYSPGQDALKIIAVTGTNGKTTIAFCIYHILKELGQKVSLLGTVKYFIGEKIKRPRHTTPDFLALRKIIREVKSQDSSFLIMEVSSHAISQGRIRGIKFSHCIFTNLSRDHLDYHKSIKNYFNVKNRLFLENKDALSIINVDDNYGKKIFSQLTRRLSYGINTKADFRAKNITLGRKGCQFDVVVEKKSFPITTKLCGRFNILNILGAIATIYSLGFSFSKAAHAISKFYPVEGRLEQAEKDIFVDYAHTPEALEKTIKALKSIGYERVICVFGCGGNRDKGKRRLMGKIASHLADFTFITSDNPRNENPDFICSQIKGGFKNENYSIVVNRKKAIAEAIKLFFDYKSRKGSGSKKICVLVAGKGHEDYQIIRGRKISFKDSKVIKHLLQGRH